MVMEIASFFMLDCFDFEMMETPEFSSHLFFDKMALCLVTVCFR